MALTSGQTAAVIGAGPAGSAAAAYQQLAPVLCSLPQPVPAFGSPGQQALIRQLLEETDWWPRRLFEELLRQYVPLAHEARQRLFACDDAGQLAI